MKHLKIKEDAASPVIGVMLMLVVTVVIAAVIAGFATGMAGDSTATTPMALLEVDNPQLTGEYLNTFDIVHKGGDEMILENIQIVVTPTGGDNTGIGLVLKGGELLNGEYKLKVLGKENSGADAVISTGDRIRVQYLQDGTGDFNHKDGDIMTWTVSDVRTTGVIAKGEFIVPKA